VEFSLAERGYLASEVVLPDRISGVAEDQVLLPHQYTVSMDMPAYLSSGRETSLKVEVRQNEPGNDLSPLADWLASVEGSVNYAGIDILPAGTIYQRLETGRAADFIWHLRGAQAPADAGTMWLYLIYNSPQDDPPVRVLVLARPLAFTFANPFGIQSLYLKIAGGIGLLTGGVVLLPGLLAYLVKVWKGIRDKKDNLDK
jgi:hypothetical protein